MRFGYLKDPLFLVCLCIYFVNRWIMKPYFPNPFSSNYLNDVICIPFWVPIMLFMMRRIRLRSGDGRPELSEIMIPLLIWSWAFEILLPHDAYFKRFDTADHVDILCYSMGALVAGVFWKWWYNPTRTVKSI